MGQQNLNPQEQAALFELLKKAGQQPTSGGMEQSVPDAAAQQGTGDINSADLSQVFGGQQQAPTSPLPPGHFKDDPAGAIAHISDVLSGKATGMQLQPGKTSGSYSASVPVDQPLLALFGLKKKMDVNSPNFLDTVKAAGIEKFLPSGLARTPNGDPYVGPKTFETALQSAQSFGPKTRASFYQVVGFDEDTNMPVTYNSANNKFFKGDKEVAADAVGRTLSKTKPQLEGSQVNDITNLLNAATQLKEVKKLFDPNATGPLQNRLMDFQQSTGIDLSGLKGVTGLSDANVKLRTIMSSSINDYIKAITGAQMSEVEARRIMKALPNPGAADEAFLPALNEILRLTDMKLQNRMDVLDTQGVVGIDKLRKLISRDNSSQGAADEPKPTAKASAPVKADAATRFQQLRKSGLSKAQAYSLMHQEGY